MDPSSSAPRGYIICGEQRSGSSFLVRVLMSTGLLGYPFEYFGRSGCRRELLADPAQGIASLLRYASTPNGVYGLKLFSAQFDFLAGARWISRLPGLHFVHLQRRDLLGQAISSLRARQTAQFVSFDEARSHAVYDRSALAHLIDEITRNQARWHAYFARNGVSPLRLYYEDVAVDPQEAANAIARLIGLGEEPRIDLARVRTTMQRDEVSQAWRERFLAETQDLDRFGQTWPRALLARVRRLRARLGPQRDQPGWTMDEPERH